MSNTEIRLIRREDIAEIIDIYRPFILDTAVTFDEQVPTEEEMWLRAQSIMQECPYLVCTVNGKVAGYAYASAYRTRASYRWAKEISVYLHPDYYGKNIAKALYTSLIEIVKAQGYCKLLAVITVPNRPSIRFHEKMGFTQCAEYKNIGYKLGEWRTVGWWELSLMDDETQAPVERVIPLNEIMGQPVFQEAIKAGVEKLIN